MEKSLPKGWVETKLGTIALVSSGYGFPTKYQGYSDYPIPFYKVGDISENVKLGKVYLQKANNYINERILKEIKGKLCPSGSIVFAKIGEAIRLNRRGILSEDSVVDNNVMSITYHQYIDNKYGFYYFRTLNLIDLSAGNAVPSIRKSTIEEIPFPLPPLAEQDRIVAKLDKLFAQHEKIKKALDRIPQLLKTFRQQVLTQAVTGKLTEQWREGKGLEVKFELENSSFRAWKFSIPSRWRVAAYGDVADVKSNLVDPNSFSDYFLIAPDNIEVNTGRLINRPLVSEINPKSGKHLFDKGVIIYSKIRPYLNKLIITDFIGLCSADMYPIDKTVYTETKFIFYYMLSNEFLSYSTTAGERSVLPKINQKGLKEIPFPLPPLQEQQEVVRRVESLFTKADTIEARYLTLKAKIDSLPQAILHKAFRGELVPQLPNDGDAKDLLAEIMALKEEVKGRKKK